MLKTIYHIIVAVLLVAQSEYVITKEPYFHKVYDACLDEVSKSGHNRSTLERDYLFIGKFAACLAQQSKHSQNASIKSKLVGTSRMINKELLDNGSSLISEFVRARKNIFIFHSEQEERNDKNSVASEQVIDQQKAAEEEPLNIYWNFNE